MRPVTWNTRSPRLRSKAANGEEAPAEGCHRDGTARARLQPHPRDEHHGSSAADGRNQGIVRPEHLSRVTNLPRFRPTQRSVLKRPRPIRDISERHGFDPVCSRVFRRIPSHRSKSARAAALGRTRLDHVEPPDRFAEDDRPSRALAPGLFDHFPADAPHHQSGIPALRRPSIRLAKSSGRRNGYTSLRWEILRVGLS